MKTVRVGHVLVVVLSVMLAAAPASGQGSSELSGSDLLKAVREKDGRARRPAYESRTAEPGTDELLRTIPAESLFCIRVNNLERTLRQADQLLAGVSPLPVGLSVVVRQELAQLLGSPEPGGVDMAGNFAFFATMIDGEHAQADPSESTYMVLLVPVSDYEQFVQDNPNVRPPDNQGISKITGSDAREVLVTRAGRFALLTLAERYDQLLGTVRSIQSKSLRPVTAALDAAEVKKAMTEPFWAYINAELAVDSNIPMMAEELAAAEELEPVEAGETTVGPGFEVVKALPLWAPSADLQKSIKDIHSISVTVRPAPENLTIGCRICARAGTECFKMFTADSAEIRELAEKAGARAPEQMTAQMGAITRLLPQAGEADFVGTCDLTKAVVAVLADLLPVEVAGSTAKAKSSLAFAAKVGDGKMDLDMALPKQHLAELAVVMSNFVEHALETSMEQGRDEVEGDELGTPEFARSDTDSDDTDEEVKLVIVGGVTSGAAEAIKEKLKEMTDDGGFSLSSSQFGDRLTIHLSPVKDVGALAKRIDFGKVTDTNVQARTIWVELTNAGTGADEGSGMDAGVAREGGSVTARLRQVDFPQMYGKVNGGYEIPLVLRLPERAVAVGEGEVVSAATISDQNLLPKNEWDRRVSFPRLSSDKRTVEFAIKLAEPNEAMVTFKEISGTLEYFTATTSRKLDSGPMDFTDGTESKEAGFSIDKIGPSEWDPKRITMELKVDLPVGAVKSSRIYDEGGRRLDVSGGSSWSGNQLTGLSFSLDGKLPARGRIVLEIYDDIKKHEVHFKFAGKGYLSDEPKASSGRMSPKRVPRSGSRRRGTTTDEYGGNSSYPRRRERLPRR